MYIYTHTHPFAHGGWRPGRECHRNDRQRLPVLCLASGGTRAPLYCHCSPPVLQCVSVCCSVLQCVAVCCSVSQCDVVWCSVLQYVAVCTASGGIHTPLCCHCWPIVCVCARACVCVHARERECACVCA